MRCVRKSIVKQLEFVKSAKLVPVQFSSRHYNFKLKKWVFEKPGDDKSFG